MTGNILTCGLCGRRGVKDFVEHQREFGGPEPERTEWRCGNHEACERRQRDAAAEETESGGGPEGTPDGVASAAAVAGLAREVEGLRIAVDPLQPLPKQLDDLANLVHQLAEDFAAQAALRSPTGAPSWLDLPTDLRTALSVLEDLTGWLRQVYLRYADARSLPACWMWHPDVVEELLWLMHASLTAYRSEGATVQLAGDWHDRYRPGVVKRINEIAGKCALANHQPRPGERLPGGPVVPLAEALEPIAVWWATHRYETPPEPDADHFDAEARLPRWGGGRR